MNAAAAAALAAALLLWVPPGAARRRRVRAVLPPPARSPDRPPSRSRWAPGVPPGRARRWVEAGVSAAAVFLLLGATPLAGAVAAGAGVAAERALRRSGGDHPGDLAGDLPVACDLLAVCLAAGTPVGAALSAVAAAVPGPLGELLGEVGALYRLGAEPRRAWSGTPSPVDALARVLARAGDSGSAVVPALQRLAADRRASDRSEIEAAVRQAGVWVLAPLGLCFLPAFLCLGVVPLVLGIAGDVFG